MTAAKQTLLALVILAAANLILADRNEELKKYFEAGMKIFKKCKSELNLSEEAGQKILNTILKYDPLPDTSEVKCFVSCQLQTAGEMTKNGSMPWDHIAEVKKTLFSEEEYKKIRKAVEICRKAEKTSGDICQRAYDSASCYYENLRKLNVAPINIGMK